MNQEGGNFEKMLQTEADFHFRSPSKILGSKWKGSHILPRSMQSNDVKSFVTTWWTLGQQRSRDGKGTPRKAEKWDGSAEW